MTEREGCRPVAILALVSALAVLPYLNALRAGFTYDDVPTIRYNQAVVGGIDPLAALDSLLFGLNYRPLTVLTFAVNHAIAPSDAAYHAVNVALHAGVAILVFALALELLPSVRSASAAALLFAVHPIHTEAVTSLVGRAELLAAFFGLLTLLAAARADRATTRWSRTGLEALSLVSFVLALLSKESAIAVLPILILFRIAIRRESLGVGLQRELRDLNWLPYVLCTVVFLVLRCYVVWTTTSANVLVPLNNILGFVPWSVRIRSAIGILWDYFGLLNLPLVLSADYSYNQVPLVQSWFSLRLLAGLAVVVALVVLALRHRHPAVRFAAALMALSLAVTANVFFVMPTIKAERLLYFPSVGWALLVAYACEQLWCVPRYRVATTGALAGIVVLFAARTWARNWDWQNNLTLYRSMVHTAPFSAKGHYNLGVELQHLHADAAALQQLEEADAIYPWAQTALGLGIEYERMGQVDTAVHWYETALQRMPGYVEAYGNLCHVLFRHGRFHAAATACRNGLRYSPTNEPLLELLGKSMIGSGSRAKGITVLRWCLARAGHDQPLGSYLAQIEGNAATVGEDVTSR